MGDMTKNFSRGEFRCRCCGANKITDEFVAKLQKLRDEYGEPMMINSGYRCPQHNAAIGGAPQSQHLKGIACDISVFTGAERYRLARLAVKHGFRGIGIAKSFVHVDIRPGPGQLWTY